MHVFADKNNKRVLLLHVPKCAGTSCGHFLHKHAKDHKWYNLMDGYYNDHMPLKIAKQITDYDYSIAFVRNPYARFVSKYAYLTHYDYHPGYQGYTINKFLDEKPNRKDPGCWTPEGWRKQIEYVDGVDQIFKLEEHDPIKVLNDLIGTNFKQRRVNQTESYVHLTEDQKKKIYSIYKEDFERLKYENLY